MVKGKKWRHLHRSVFFFLERYTYSKGWQNDKLSSEFEWLDNAWYSLNLVTCALRIGDVKSRQKQKFIKDDGNMS